jgi:hypothetical protein
MVGAETNDAQKGYAALVDVAETQEKSRRPSTAGSEEKSRRPSAAVSVAWSVQAHPSDGNNEIEDLFREDSEVEDAPSGGCVASCKRTVKLTLEGPKDGAAANCVQSTIICCILLSTACVMAETIHEVEKAFQNLFNALENVFTFVFTVEIVVRVWVADNAWRYFITIANVVDILAVLPWYIEFTTRNLIPYTPDNGFDSQMSHSFHSLRMVRIVRMIRLSRVARLAKAARHSETITTMIQSVRGSAAGLSALLACICMGTVFSATAIYYLECDDPDTQFTSIPASIWWALPTITGVGYGDMVPMTVPGRIAASLSMVVGTLITSLCVAILTNSFIEQFNKNVKQLKFQQRRANSNAVEKKRKMKAFAPTSSMSLSDEFALRTSSSQAFQHIVFGEDCDAESLMAHLHFVEDEVSSLMTHLQTVSERKVFNNQASIEILEDHSRSFFKHLKHVVEQVVEEPDSPGLSPKLPKMKRRSSAEFGSPASLSSLEL